MRRLDYCARLPRSAHGLKVLPFAVGRVSPSRHINSGSSLSINTLTARRQWASYILVFSAAFGGAVAYRRYRNPTLTDILNPQTFTPFKLVSKESVSPTCSIFTFRAPHVSHHGSFDQNLWNGVWSVQIKQPQLQIARAYTPLPPSHVSSVGTSEDAHEDAQDLRVLIRKEPKGEVSGYLHKLPEGAAVEFRGPNIEYVLPKDVEEVVFLAGGTGIAPALQVAHSLLEATTEAKHGAKPRVHILWACRKREDCLGGLSESGSRQKATAGSTWSTMLGSSGTTPAGDGVTNSHGRSRIVEELEAFKTRHPDQISIDYFVDEEKRFITVEHIQRRITPRTSDTRTDPGLRADGIQSNKFILVSGPDGFVDYYAGPKKWEGGKEVQGSLGGALARLNLQEWQVWKL